MQDECSHAKLEEGSPEGKLSSSTHPLQRCGGRPLWVPLWVPALGAYVKLRLRGNENILQRALTRAHVNFDGRRDHSIYFPTLEQKPKKIRPKKHGRALVNGQSIDFV